MDTIGFRAIRELYLFVGLFSVTACYQGESADLIVHNAVIVTMNGPTERFEAMAVRDGRIIELGPERQILNKYNATQTYDAGGQTVLPGFIDGHCHFLGYGLNLQKVDLSGTRSFQEVVERVTAFAAANPDKEWIVGRGWDQNDWAVAEYPGNDTLNELFPDRPVLLQRIDGHAALINQATIEKSGLDLNKQVEGGQIIFKDGRFTGILVDNAVDVFQKIFDDAPENEKRSALLEAQADAFRLGLTMVVDAGLDTGSIQLIEKMMAAGELKIRIVAMASDKPEDLAYFEQRGPIKDDRFIVRSVKVYADGALGSRGALLKKPYADDPGHYGLLLRSRAHLDSVASWCRIHGFQMATHCIGDSSNALVLDVYAQHLQGVNDLRWRIEHAQTVSPSDRKKFKDNSVIPSVQPTHATSDMYWAEQRLGPERIGHAYAYRSLKDQLGLIALGTDFPVEGMDPLNTLRSAVLRTDEKDWPSGGFQPDQALTVEDALLGMTIWNAIATFSEGSVGSIEVGKFADLVVLNMDPTAIASDRLRKIKVVATFINGEQVH